MKHSHRLFAIGLICLLVVASPKEAEAQIGWLDWLEELSGPGPFDKRGLALDWRLFCRIEQANNDDRWAANLKANNLPAIAGQRALQSAGRKYFPCSTIPGHASDSSGLRVADYVTLRFGSVSTDSTPLFQDVDELSGVVTARLLDVAFLRQVKGFSVGAGAGAIWFTGSTLDRKPLRATFTPIVGILKPFELIAGAERFGDLLAIRIEMIGVLGGYKATDFNSGSTSTFSSGGEFLFSRSVSFNFGVLLR